MQNEKIYLIHCLELQYDSLFIHTLSAHRVLHAELAPTSDLLLVIYLPIYLFLVYQCGNPIFGPPLILSLKTQPRFMAVPHSLCILHSTC